jgi:hypothetical protein
MGGALGGLGGASGLFGAGATGAGAGATTAGAGGSGLFGATEAISPFTPTGVFGAQTMTPGLTGSITGLGASAPAMAAQNAPMFSGSQGMFDVAGTQNQILGGIGQQTAMGGGSATAKTASYVLTAADAGTTVIMNSASSTTITVNTALFSAGDTVNIQNIGAGVCTITAGTATVNTAGSLAMVQYEGGVLYFVSASVATYFDYFQAGGTTPLTTKGDLFGFDTANARIPIGTNNQVLTADSAQALGLKWATPTAAAQSFSLLGTGTTTSGSTVTVSGISGINNIFILIRSVSTNAANDNLFLRVNGDTSSIYNLYATIIGAPTTYASTFLGNYDNPSDSRWQIGGYSNNQLGVMVGGITLSGCNSSGAKMMTGLTGATGGGGYGQSNFQNYGYYTGSSTISSVSLIAGSGTFDSGSFLVYGSA